MSQQIFHSVTLGTAASRICVASQHMTLTDQPSKEIRLLRILDLFMTPNHEAGRLIQARRHHKREVDLTRGLICSRTWKHFRRGDRFDSSVTGGVRTLRRLFR